MLAATLLPLLLGSESRSLSLTPAVAALDKRQFDPPSECAARCTTFTPIYAACRADPLSEGCLKVCAAEEWAPYADCLKCIEETSNASFQSTLKNVAKRCEDNKGVNPMGASASGSAGSAGASASAHGGAHGAVSSAAPASSSASAAAAASSSASAAPAASSSPSPGGAGQKVSVSVALVIAGVVAAAI